jgi:hypothetical protein
MTDHRAWEAPLSISIEHLMRDIGRYVDFIGGAGQSHVKEDLEEEDEEAALAQEYKWFIYHPSPVDLVFLILVEFFELCKILTKIEKKIKNWYNFIFWMCRLGLWLGRASPNVTPCTSAFQSASPTRLSDTVWETLLGCSNILLF